MVALERAVARWLRRRQRQRALGREQARNTERVVEHRLLDAVQQPDVQRLAGLDQPAGQDQLLGDPDRGRPREPDGAAPAGNDPEVDLGLAELRVRRRVAEIAGKRQLAAAAESEAVDRSDRRLRHLLEQPAAFVPQRAPAPGLLDREAAHVLDVRSGHEGLVAGAGQHDHARFLVLGELAQAVTQLLQRRPVEGVHRLRPVDGDGGDPAVALDPNAQAGTLPFKKSTISAVGAPGVKTPATP